MLPTSLIEIACWHFAPVGFNLRPCHSTAVLTQVTPLPCPHERVVPPGPLEDSGVPQRPPLPRRRGLFDSQGPASFQSPAWFVGLAWLGSEYCWIRKNPFFWDLLLIFWGFFWCAEQLRAWSVMPDRSCLNRGQLTKALPKGLLGLCLRFEVPFLLPGSWGWAYMSA